ncbi:MAG: hypothetical protein CL484_03835 [Acidobacteria bacterium]|nr:hypothetical protein [Acidobacteriota bacterium]
MTTFGQLSWILCSLTTIILFASIKRWRYLLVKPSFAFLIAFHLQLQWPGTIQANWIEEFVADQWDYFWLVHVFPLATLAVSALTMRGKAEETFARVTGNLGQHPLRVEGGILLLSLIVAATVGWYLGEVALSATGLWQAFEDPMNYEDARAESLKLLTNPALRYAFEWIATIFGPLLTVLCVFRCVTIYRSGNRVMLAPYLLLIGCVLVAVSLYGAKGPAAKVLLVAFFFLYSRRGFPLNPIQLALIAVLVLSLPVMIVMVHTDTAFTMQNVIDAYGIVFDRAFGRNILSGVWAVDYAQREGYFGISGIPKLAVMVGTTPVDIFEKIGFYYRPNDVTISPNSSFVFSHYACFGLASILPSILLTVLLDLVMLVYTRIRGSMLLAAVSVCSIGSLKFAESMFTTTLITGGVLIAPFVSWFMDVWAGSVRHTIGNRKGGMVKAQ